MYHVYIQIHGEEQFVSGCFHARSSSNDYLRYLHTIAISSLALELIYPPPPLLPCPAQLPPTSVATVGQVGQGKDIVVFAGTHLICSCPTIETEVTMANRSCCPLNCSSVQA